MKKSQTFYACKYSFRVQFLKETRIFVTEIWRFLKQKVHKNFTAFSILILNQNHNNFLLSFLMKGSFKVEKVYHENLSSF